MKYEFYEPDWRVRAIEMIQHHTDAGEVVALYVYPDAGAIVIVHGHEDYDTLMAVDSHNLAGVYERGANAFEISEDVTCTLDCLNEGTTLADFMHGR